MNVTIKEANYWAIHDFTLFGDTNRIQGTKLEALYKLIQKKGEPMQSKDPKFNGVKVLEFSKGSYVGLIHKPVKPNSFFPCRLQQFHLQNLSNDRN